MKSLKHLGNACILRSVLVLVPGICHAGTITRGTMPMICLKCFKLLVVLISTIGLVSGQARANLVTFTWEESDGQDATGTIVYELPQEDIPSFSFKYTPFPSDPSSPSYEWGISDGLVMQLGYLSVVTHNPESGYQALDLGSPFPGIPPFFFDSWLITIGTIGGPPPVNFTGEGAWVVTSGVIPEPTSLVMAVSGLLLVSAVRFGQLRRSNKRGKLFSIPATR
jgi:hypothetical protein